MNSPIASPTTAQSGHWRFATRILLTMVCLSIAVFWVWALFFPPTKQSVAKLDDEQWAIRADAICEAANLERDSLTDLRRIDSVGDGALAARADIIDQATAIIQTMLNDVVSSQPTGPQDVRLMDTWASIFQGWINERREYTVVLRSGENAPFAESMLEGGPVSKYITDFAMANRMNNCSAPLDLAA